MGFGEGLKNTREKVKSIPKGAIDGTKQTFTSLKNGAEQGAKVIDKVVKTINPLDKESKQKRLIEKARIHNETTAEIKQALNPLPKVDEYDLTQENISIVNDKLEKFYNKGKCNPEDIVSLVNCLTPAEKKQLKSHLESHLFVPIKQVTNKSKLGKLLTKAVDVVDDASERIGVGRYEKDEFQDIIIAALSPKPSPDSFEGKTITKINDLVNNQDFPGLVDILQKLSPINTGDIGRTGAGALGVMAVTSGGLLPMLAAGLMGVRRIRQAKIKHLASKNEALRTGIITEIDNRLKGNNISSGAQKRLKEIKELLGATA